MMIMIFTISYEQVYATAYVVLFLIFLTTN